MAGIYIHIPFCKKACNYCNFHFSTQHELINELVDSLVAEMALQKNYLTEAVETIYLGGGTPSLLSPTQINQLLNAIDTYFSIAPYPEITLEANPDDINLALIQEWKTIGVNRLSIGIQSFHPDDLKWMNRAHTAQQALGVIPMAQDAGIHNLSIDLIYGSPSLTEKHWIQNLQTAFGFGIPHLSCYALTVEPKTLLAKKIEQKKITDIDLNQQANHFEQLIQQTSEAGYEQYEISNFSLTGKRSKHNTGYWGHKNYLGIGPSAHSFNGESRQWNIANNSLYIQSIKKEVIPFELEILSKTQKINEYIMTALRTIEGIHFETLNHIAQQNLTSSITADASKYLDTAMMVKKSGYLQLSNKGKFYADGIAAHLFRG